MIHSNHVHSNIGQSKYKNSFYLGSLWIPSKPGRQNSKVPFFGVHNFKKNSVRPDTDSSLESMHIKVLKCGKIIALHFTTVKAHSSTEKGSNVLHAKCIFFIFRKWDPFCHCIRKHDVSKKKSQSRKWKIVFFNNF